MCWYLARGAPAGGSATAVLATVMNKVASSAIPAIVSRTNAGQPARARALRAASACSSGIQLSSTGQWPRYRAGMPGQVLERVPRGTGSAGALRGRQLTGQAFIREGGEFLLAGPRRVE